LDSKQLLRTLTQEMGFTGYESRVASLVRNAFSDLCDEVRTDKLGNVIGKKRGEALEPRASVMLAGHMDEVGLMVTGILERGFLQFTTVGVDRRTIPAAEVTVNGVRDVPGIISVKPPHILSPEDRQKSYKTEDMTIDTGLTDAQARELVHVGDPVTIKRDFMELQNSLVAGKAFDDRVAVIAICECLALLKTMKHGADVYPVATAQEELGMRGAGPAAYGVFPDIAIAINVGFGDQPGVPDDRQIALDKGPALAVGPNIHPRLFLALKNAATEAGIAYQVEATPGRSGTDAWSMQMARSGVATAIISIPNRNMHTSVEVCSMNDIKKAGKLLAQFIMGVDRALVEGLTWS